MFDFEAGKKEGDNCRKVERRSSRSTGVKPPKLGLRGGQLTGLEVLLADETLSLRM